MSCCGQKRLALRGAVPEQASSRGGGSAYRASFLVGSTRVQEAGRAPSGTVLTYRGVGLFSSRGNRSGRLYSCDGTGATLDVDPADVEGLMRTRLFSR